MYEDLTDSAKKVLRFAHQAAARLNHGQVSTAHLLLGLTKVRDGVAVKLFKNLEVDLGKIRNEVEKRIQLTTETGGTDPGQLSPAAKICIKLAAEEAMDFQQEYIDTEHILLALMREPRGTAAKVLIDLGLELQEMREEVEHILSDDDRGT